MSSKAHFGVVILPAFCLAREAAASKSRLLGALLLAAAALGLCAGKDVLGERLYTWTLWCGAVTWQTLLLLLGCVVALRRQGSAAAVQAPPCPAEALRADAA
jgi:hypothetical protein